MKIQTRVLRVDPQTKLSSKIESVRKLRIKKQLSVGRMGSVEKDAFRESMQALSKKKELSMRELGGWRKMNRSFGGRKKGADVEWARRTRLAKKIVQFLEGRGRAARNPALREWAVGEIQRRRWKENVVREWAKGFFRGSLRERKYLRREEVAARTWERREARAEEDGLN